MSCKLGNKSEMDDEWFKETLSNFLNNKLINDAVIALSKKDINGISWEKLNLFQKLVWES